MSRGVFVLLLFLAYSCFPHFPPYLIVPNREIAINRILQVHFPASSPHAFELGGGGGGNAALALPEEQKEVIQPRSAPLSPVSKNFCTEQEGESARCCCFALLPLHSEVSRLGLALWGGTKQIPPASWLRLCEQNHIKLC